MKKILIIPLLLVVFTLSAAPIGERRAREIATEFFKKQASRATSPLLNLVWAGDDIATIHKTRSSVNKETGLLYIYNRTDAKGFVVVAGDSDVDRPIVAFSYDNSFDVENMADGARYMLESWCRQISAARRGVLPPSRNAVASEPGAIEVQHSTAQWNQGTPFNNEAPIYDGYSCATGCVATAMSIICYYNKWPERGRGTTPEYAYKDVYEVDRVVPSNELGRRYDYSVMRSDNYMNGYTTQEGAAVAALMKDMGTSVRMNYHYTGSGAFSFDVPIALSTYFGYSKNAQLLNRDKYSYDEWESMLKTNIATFGPTYISGDDGSSGHAFITDGYTTGGYFSINFGWGGVSNGFYLLPNITYIYGLDALFYLEPDRNGMSGSGSYLELIPLVDATTEYRGFYSLSTEYRAGEMFMLSIAGLQNVGTETFRGDIRVVWCDESGNEKQSMYHMSGEELASTTEKPGIFWYYLGLPAIEIPFVPTIEYGDRLRIQYKDNKDTEWRWARSSWGDAVNIEHIMKARPDDIAARLQISYNKTNKTLMLTPALAVHYELIDPQSNVVASGGVIANTIATIDLSKCQHGVYKLCVRCGGDPYVLCLEF